MTEQHAERSDGDLNHDMLPTISGVGESEREAGSVEVPPEVTATESSEQQSKRPVRTSPASPPSLTPEREQWIRDRCEHRVRRHLGGGWKAAEDLLTALDAARTEAETLRQR